MPTSATLKKIVLSLCFMIVLPYSLLAADQFLTLDSLAGKAEVQKAGQEQWVLVKNGEKLFNNDLIRVLDKSTARLKFSNGSLMYVRQNSQILISLFENSETNLISKHITVFFGAVFFIVKKTLPLGPLDLDDIKVYTPTSVVSMRGTSFLVSVDEKSGASDVEVINGTVLVRNILKNVSLFIGAGYKTNVALSTDPVLPVALLQADIDAIKLWVPMFIMEREMEEQLAKAKRDHYIITGKLDDKVVILPFDNKSHYKGPWGISRKIATALMNRISETNSALVVKVADSAASDPLKFGNALKARFVIAGTIQEFDIKQHAEITVRADEYKEYNIAQVTTYLQLIDVASKKMIYDNTFSGELTVKNSANSTWQYVRKLDFNLHDSTFAQTIIGKAATSMLDQAVEKLTLYLRH
ncbi:MAG: FecR domain-containing protein [Chitinivibrionales bacterium]|nr:FecR domain-containing protein [Chitinivibrionales bacterium]